MASRRPRSSDEIFYGSSVVQDQESEGSGLTLLVVMAVVIILALVSLPLLDSVITNAVVRWGFLLLVLAACAIGLIWAVYPRKVYQPMTAPAPQWIDDGPGAAEREVNMIANALQGSPFSQLNAYIELREMLIRRYMLIRHLPRAEAEAVLDDAGFAKRELRDEDLAWLLSFNFKRAYEQLALSTEEGQSMVRGFPRTFPSLLKKVEALN